MENLQPGIKQVEMAFEDNESGISTTEYEERQARRQARREQMKRRKARQLLLRRISLIAVPLVLILGAVFGIRALVKGVKAHSEAQKQETAVTIQSQIEEAQPEKESLDDIQTEPEPEAEEVTEDSDYGQFADEYSEEKNLFFDGYAINSAGAAAYPPEDQVYSNYAVLVDADDGHVIASKAATTRINPASMTKILTILVAAEHVENLDDTYRIDPSITSFVYNNDCSAVGFSNDEIVTVRDLMYGTILPSGGDAAMALAEYVAGSEERFVDMMNVKLEELGLSDTTHFTNCVGIYDEDHYSTVTDMAMIMKAAVENELAKEILTEHTYTTTATAEHEEGITISNWFLRRIEDKDTHGTVVCAKTGFVDQSGCCAASYELGNDGGHYICVTADAWSSWRCIYDHVAMYDLYVPE